MTKKKAPSPSAQKHAEGLAEQGAEMLRAGRFKEAVELFKRLGREDPKPEWTQFLVQAYVGRARALAAKGMYKEALIVLENTAIGGGIVQEPRLYLSCLLHQNAWRKAAAYGLRCLGQGGMGQGGMGQGGMDLSGADAGRIADVTAALWLAGQAPEESADALAAPGRIADSALAAWSAGAPAAEIDRLLQTISLRSPFKPVRLVLKSLLLAGAEPDRAVRMLEMIPEDSAFAGLGQAVRVIQIADPVERLAAWRHLSDAQRAFAAEALGLPEDRARRLTELEAAERQGPAALLAFLLRQPPGRFPEADVRAACLSLLPQVSDRLAQVEKRFGPLSGWERERILALFAESRQQWAEAERHWRKVIDALEGEPGEENKLAQAVIWRHLAGLTWNRFAPSWGREEEDPVASCLEHSLEADPEDRDSILALLHRHREQGRTKDWNKWVEWAVRRLPDDSAVLMQAMEAAAARNAYKKASDFARKLLAVDPINQPARQGLIEAQMAHARKQMRSGRADLAWKDLASAAAWERPDAPDGLLRIGRGLVGLRLGQGAEALERIREGAGLLGGKVAGWFRAALEAHLMGGADSETRMPLQELAAAQKGGAASKPEVMAPEVMAVVAALGRREVRENRRTASAALSWVEAWLKKARGFDWSPAEFQAIAETLHRLEAFDLLGVYAGDAIRRHPDEPVAHYYRIVARTQGQARHLSVPEEYELEGMMNKAADRQDFHTVNRIQRYLEAAGVLPGMMGGPPPFFEDGDDGGDDPVDDLQDIVESRLDEVLAIIDQEGPVKAVDSVMAIIRSTPLGKMMPRSLARQLSQALVDELLAGGPGSGGGPKPGRRGRRGFF